MFIFCIENHEPFGALTKNFPKLDNNKRQCPNFRYLQSTNRQLVPFKKATMRDVSISSVNVSICISIS